VVSLPIGIKKKIKILFGAMSIERYDIKNFVGLMPDSIRSKVRF
jgi:hypothetical protein